MPANSPAKNRACKHAKRVAWRKVADEAVILDTDTAEYYSLAGAGLRMWELLGKGKSPEQIAHALAREYDCPPERIRRDCLDLIGALLKRKILERA